ncbi:META domain-containing protein [Pseudanabaenaceae cyanobacterium LEGE 13415]|nr:META domain-containing protein [Pseudanabaenaceae cyanobacterium LEGE 13415]
MAQSPSLSGSWRLTSMAETALPTPMVPSGELTVDFAGDRISGSGGCNRFTGGYEAKGEQLIIGTLGSTRKACESGKMDQEMRYLMALQGAQRYEINSRGELSIFYETEQNSGVLRFTSSAVRGLW